MLDGEGALDECSRMATRMCEDGDFPHPGSFNQSAYLLRHRSPFLRATGIRDPRTGEAFQAGAEFRLKKSNGSISPTASSLLSPTFVNA